MEHIEVLKRAVGLPAKPEPFQKRCGAFVPRAVVVGHVAQSVWFTSVIMLFIIFDSTVAGIEADWAQGDSLEDTAVYWAIDLFVGLVFLGESAAKFHLIRWEYFADPWNIFDFFCVVMGLAAVAQPLQAATDKDNLRMIKAIKGFRVLRLFRIVKYIGGLQALRGLWLLIISFLSGVKTLMWTCLLWALCMYCLSIVLIVLVSDEIERMHAAWPGTDLYVGSVWRAILTLWQVCTFDDWASEIGRPLLESAPIGLIVVFASMVVISFGIINVILAVLIEHVRTAMTKMNLDTERRLKICEEYVMNSMQNDVRKFVKSGSGELEYEDFVSLCNSASFGMKLRLVGLRAAEATEIFELLDPDGSGSIAFEEFTRALHKIKGLATGHDLLHVISFLQRQVGRAKGYLESVRRMSEQADVLQERLNLVGLRLTSEIEQKRSSTDRGFRVRQLAAVREMTLESMAAAQRTTYPQATVAALRSPSAAGSRGGAWA
mmetsp:Transcript_62097/g.178666  ORF Transcript_62097/g.178666 Transcript_62097/m.178666 type:complete len:489 (-) Transcript_62097:156-1622(-)